MEMRRTGLSPTTARGNVRRLREHLAVIGVTGLLVFGLRSKPWHILARIEGNAGNKKTLTTEDTEGHRRTGAIFFAIFAEELALFAVKFFFAGWGELNRKGREDCAKAAKLQAQVSVQGADRISGTEV